jgi:hypothetical protein
VPPARKAVEVRSQLTAELVRLGNMVTVSGDGGVFVRPAPYLRLREEGPHNGP